MLSLHCEVIMHGSVASIIDTIRSGSFAGISVCVAKPCTCRITCTDSKHAERRTFCYVMLCVTVESKQIEVATGLLQCTYSRTLAIGFDDRHECGNVTALDVATTLWCSVLLYNYV